MSPRAPFEGLPFPTTKSLGHTYIYRLAFTAVTTLAAIN